MFLLIFDEIALALCLNEEQHNNCQNVLERAVVGTNFLNPDVTFAGNERLRCGVGVRESYNARDVLETTMIVHTNLKEKSRYLTIPVVSNIYRFFFWEGLIDHWESADPGVVGRNFKH